MTVQQAGQWCADCEAELIKVAGGDHLEEALTRQEPISSRSPMVVVVEGAVVVVVEEGEVCRQAGSTVCVMQQPTQVRRGSNRHGRNGHSYVNHALCW